MSESKYVPQSKDKEEKEETKKEESKTEEIGGNENENAANKYSLADIDLTDPEVEAAAAKIQSAFKMRGKKSLSKK